MVVVAAHAERVQLATPLHHAARIRPLRDEISREDQAVALRVARLAEKGVELVEAPMHVPDDDRLTVVGFHFARSGDVATTCRRRSRGVVSSGESSA